MRSSSCFHVNLNEQKKCKELVFQIPFFRNRYILLKIGGKIGVTLKEKRVERFKKMSCSIFWKKTAYF